ncbi:MAG TPA: hypothetical protein VEX68_30630, partial [Bryobacteraceae bacterium]|nr:hypothetical protein [Bryobacteraceae bacterium]
SDLREVSRKLKAILPGISEGGLRGDLQQMQQQADAAIEYYSSLLVTEKPEPSLAFAQRVAEAAIVPLSGVGLVIPGLPVD